MIRFFDRAIVGPVGEVKVEELTVATWLQVSEMSQCMSTRTVQAVIWAYWYVC